MNLLIPWGSPHEHERSQRMAQGIGTVHCTVGHRQSIADWALQLNACRLVVGVDTGLTHLAAAAGVPCLALFTQTSPSILTSQSPALARTVGGDGITPALEEVKQAATALLKSVHAFESKAERAWTT